jgi:hypothetical protein
MRDGLTEFLCTAPWLRLGVTAAFSVSTQRVIYSGLSPNKDYWPKHEGCMRSCPLGTFIIQADHVKYGTNVQYHVHARTIRGCTLYEASQWQMLARQHSEDMCRMTKSLARPRGGTD